MFSERKAPISELVKGDPEKPLREPALALFACLFNLYQIYLLSQTLTSISLYPSVDPWMGFFYQMQMGVIAGLIWFNIIASILLVIGAGLIHFVHRRIGAALILVVSIIALLVSFVSVSYVFFMRLDILALFTNFLGAIFGLMAGIMGIRSERATTPATVQEII